MKSINKKFSDFKTPEDYRRYLIEDERKNPSLSKTWITLLGIIPLLVAYFIWDSYISKGDFQSIELFSILTILGFILVYIGMFGKSPSELSSDEMRKTFNVRKKILNFVKENLKK